ncbi:hypothetical protein SEPCBS57363_006247 [Sporothrix epigloea]|uniref:Calcineurin-like phosphoesterase domain-containing protein n=1 Tax=Sporothrix epigloea TaxID=1892477 RepID=A0ABP0E201_9PEZI
MNVSQGQPERRYFFVSTPGDDLDTAAIHRAEGAGAGSAPGNDASTKDSKLSSNSPTQQSSVSSMTIEVGENGDIDKKMADTPALLASEDTRGYLKQKDSEVGLRLKKSKIPTLAELLEKPMDAMEYGTTARPPIRGLTTRIADLPVELVIDGNDVTAAGIARGSTTGKPLRRRRFVFIGDVHGQRKSLDELLDKIGFKVGIDHLVFVGNLINKGPDSAGIVQLAMDAGASAVRGSHEDRVLRAYESLQAIKQHASPAPKLKVSDTGDEYDGSNKIEVDAERRRIAILANIEVEGKRERASAMLQREIDLREEDAAKSTGILTFLGFKKQHKEEEDIIDHEKMVAELEIDPLEQNPFSHGDAAERATASTLSPDHARWLAELPVILRIGPILPTKGLSLSPAAQQANIKSPFSNNVVVVHAGLVPDLPLEKQDPYAVMVMRSLVYPADEVRHDRARLIAEALLRTESRGRIKNTNRIDVLNSRVEKEYRRMQRHVYGSDPHHPRRPAPPGAPHNWRVSGAGKPEPADLVTLPIEGHFREGLDRVHWAAVWNQAQHANPDPANRTTVVYGHDAITGLLVPETVSSGLFSLFSSNGNGVNSGSVITKEDTGYTFGLDSGAVYGGKLTALVVEAEVDGVVKYRIEQVSCPATVIESFAD